MYAHGYTLRGCGTQKEDPCNDNVSTLSVHGRFFFKFLVTVHLFEKRVPSASRLLYTEYQELISQYLNTYFDKLCGFPNREPKHRIEILHRI